MAWSLTSHPTSSFASGTSTSKAFSTSPASGDLLLLMLFINNATVTFGSTPTGASITGSWVPLAGTGVNSSGAVQSYQCWGAINNATGTSTISISWTGAGSGDILLADFTGITGAVSQDGSVATANSTGSTTITTPSFTPGITGDLLVQAGLTSAGITATSGGTPAWTQGDVGLAGTSDGWGWQSGGTSATAANITTNNSAASNTAVIFGVKASGSAGSTGLPDLIMAPPHR